MLLLNYVPIVAPTSPMRTLRFFPLNVLTAQLPAELPTRSCTTTTLGTLYFVSHAGEVQDPGFGNAIATVIGWPAMLMLALALLVDTSRLPMRTR